MRWHGRRAAVLAATLMALTPLAPAGAAPWVASADYAAGPNGVPQGDLVGPFDTYDLGVGPVLLKGALVAWVGDTIDVYYQSYLTGHEDIIDLAGEVAAPHLNATGAGSGYELTLAVHLTETVTSVVSKGSSGIFVTYEVSGGTADLYLDGSPDFDLAADSGFTDGAGILSAMITGGAGSLFVPPAGDPIGVVSVDFGVTGFDAAIFDPDTLTIGRAVFSQQVPPSFGPDDGPSVSMSVLGHPFDEATDLLLGADGNAGFQVVPEPLSLLLVGSAIAGLLIHRRRG